VIEAPPADDVAITYQPEELIELNLLRAGVSTLIWATGYDLDYGWIDAPTLDDLAIPQNVRGVATVPGPLLPRTPVAALAGVGLPHRASARRPTPRRSDGRSRAARYRERAPVLWRGSQPRRETE
jgi:hypothetical protein